MARLTSAADLLKFPSRCLRRCAPPTNGLSQLIAGRTLTATELAHRGRLEENALPVFESAARGLENYVIRREVCAVLEGGAQAFRQRARRLQIDAPAYTSNDANGTTSEGSA